MPAWGLYLFAGLVVASLPGRGEAQVVYPGVPTQNCNCPLDFRPVCGSNAKTYNSACQLRCEQAYIPALFQMSEGVCGSTSQVYGPFTSGSSASGIGYPSGSQTGSTYPGYSDYGSTCSWGCPAASLGSMSGQTYGSSSYMPYVHGYSNSSSFSGGNFRPYRPYGMGGAGSSLYATSSNIQVCDHRGNVYANDCLYYRAVCEAERRGDFLMKRTCMGGLTNSNIYGGFNPSNYRGGALLANEVGTTPKPKSG